MSTHAVHRSRSPMRGYVEGPTPCVGAYRVPVFEDHVVETRVPVVERVERTIETIPMGHRVHHLERSRSPLLHTTTYGGYDAARMSASTPIAHSSMDNK